MFSKTATVETIECWVMYRFRSYSQILYQRNVDSFVLAIFFVRLTFELKLWVRLSQGVLARGDDVVAASEVECLEIRTSSCYFQHTGVCDVVAESEVECLEI